MKMHIGDTVIFGDTGVVVNDEQPRMVTGLINDNRGFEYGGDQWVPVHVRDGNKNVLVSLTNVIDVQCSHEGDGQELEWV